MRKITGKISLIILFATTAIYLSLPDAAAQQPLELKVGPAKIKPRMGIYCEYFSNIFLTKNDKKGSLTEKINPGLNVKVPFERLYLEADGQAQYLYINQTHKHTWMYDISQLIRYDLSRLTSIGLRYNYSRGGFFEALPDQEYHLSQGQAMITHQFSPRLKCAFLGDMEEYGTHIKDGKSIYSDYTQYDGGFNLDYKLTSMTTLGASYLFADRRFHDTDLKNYRSHDGTVSITYKITPRTSVGANAGYQYQNYKIGKDAGTLSFGANLQMILSNVSTLNFDYSHGFQDTFYPREPNELRNPFVSSETLSDVLDDTYRYLNTDSVGASLNYNLSQRDTIVISGRLLKMRSDQGLGALAGQKLRESSYYGGAEYTHRFTPWLSLRAKGTYGALDSNVREEYNYYIGSAGIVISF